MIFICGIGGILPLTKDISKTTILEIAKHLLIENRIRGGDASGLASWDIEKNKIIVYKQAEEAKDFIPNLKEEYIVGPTMVHCRAKTRGDPADPENNHPMYGEKFCLIHNGIVPSMVNLPEYKYKGQCDTEVLLSYIEQFGIRDGITKIDGSAALAIMSPENKTFYLYRHTSPLFLAYYPGKAFVFSSTESSLKKVGTMLGVERLWNLFSTQMMVDFDEGQFFSIHIETHGVLTDNIKIESTTTNTGYCCVNPNKKEYGAWGMGYD